MALGRSEILRRRVQIASLVELAVYVLSTLSYGFYKWSFLYGEARDAIYYNETHVDSSKTVQDLVGGLILSPVLLILAALIFISTLSFLLTDQTPVVANLLRAGTTAGIAARLFPFLPHIEAESIDIEQKTGFDAPNAADLVGYAFEQYISRSQLAAKTAQGRPNALLFIGGRYSCFFWSDLFLPHASWKQIWLFWIA